MSWLGILLGVLAVGNPITVVFLARLFFISITVQGDSMLPTLKSGEQILILRSWMTNKLKRDQIVVFYYPQKKQGHPTENLFVKRLVALPGERVSVTLDELPLVWQDKEGQHFKDSKRTWNIPPKYCFVRSDNIGADSLIWGPIPSNLIAGVMIAKLDKLPSFKNFKYWISSR